MFPYLQTLQIPTTAAETVDEAAQRLLTLIAKINEFDLQALPQGEGQVAIQLAGLSNMTQTMTAYALRVAYQQVTGKDVPEEYVARFAKDGLK